MRRSRRLGDTEEPGASAAPAERAAPATRSPRGQRPESLARLVDGAVFRSLERTLRQHGGDPARVKRLIRQEFQALLRSNGRVIRGVLRRSFLIELQRAHAELLISRERASEELRALELEKANLAGRLEAPGRQASLLLQSASAIDEGELEQALVRVLARAQGSITPRLLASELKEETLSFLRGTLARVQEQRDREIKEEIDRYERRIAKLKDSLERTEALLEELRASPLDEEGKASIYRTVQGLSAGAARLEQKKALLSRIYEANLALREGLAQRLPASPA